VLKVFPLRFINAFLILYYYIVTDGNLARVSTSLAVFLVSSTVSSFGIAHLLPAVAKCRAEAALRKAAEAEIHRAAALTAARRSLGKAAAATVAAAVQSKEAGDISTYVPAPLPQVRDSSIIKNLSEFIFIFPFAYLDF